MSVRSSSTAVRCCTALHDADSHMTLPLHAMHRDRMRSAAWLAALVLWCVTAFAEVAIPPLDRPVTDLTGTLSPQQVQTLDQKLRALDAAKGARIAILLLPTTAPETIEEYSIRAAESRKLGRGDVDDGVLLVVAKDDRAVRIEVGYGLEGALPDVHGGSHREPGDRAALSRGQLFRRHRCRQSTASLPCSRAKRCLRPTPQVAPQPAVHGRSRFGIPAVADAGVRLQQCAAPHVRTRRRRYRDGGHCRHRCLAAH